MSSPVNRCVTWFGAVSLVAWSLCGCVALGPGLPKAPSFEERIGSIALELLEAAALRADTGTTRVCLHDVREFESGPCPAAGRGSEVQGPPPNAPSDPLGDELTRELLVALASHTNVMDSRVRPGRRAAPTEGDARGTGGHYGVTHSLLGSYVRRDGRLILALRLVDTQTGLVVAAVRETFEAPRLDVTGNAQTPLIIVLPTALADTEPATPSPPARRL